ncbi:MAG: hypothetical protein E7573_01250 [Ruminococcaceae bacterium]|nr:hypothetical protein [Oscillospiraceae bacterium]
MDKNKAIKYVLENARPLELAVYKYFFENESKQAVIDELAEFQNTDGGFGHALEPDFFNPDSSPIATNDAIITLSRVNALDRDSEMVKGIVRYLESHDSFNEDKKRWLFAIDSNKDYPHAIWWEKKDDGISKFNPSVSLAAFMVCYGKRTSLYEEIIKEAIEYLKDGEISGDAVNCYLLAYELLTSHSIDDIVDLNAFKTSLSKAIENCICKDISKYGVEYVPMPSVIFTGKYMEFITPEIIPLINAEKDILGKLQMEDGGFDITWKWYTPYTDEYEQARNWWRPRITIEKLLFNEIQIGESL